MNRLDREISVLAGKLHRLPWGDPGRPPLAAILRGKRAHLAYRLRASEAAFERYLARGAV
jgi:hypothetical protein